MRRILTFAASLLLAAPAAAQQANTELVAPEPTQAAAPAPAPAPVKSPLAAPVQDKRLDVDREQARQNLDASEHASAATTAGHPWWWLVAAIAAGIVIAAVILD